MLDARLQPNALIYVKWLPAMHDRLAELERLSGGDVHSLSDLDLATLVFLQARAAEAPFTCSTIVDTIERRHPEGGWNPFDRQHWLHVVQEALGAMLP